MAPVLLEASRDDSVATCRNFWEICGTAGHAASVDQISVEEGPFFRSGWPASERRAAGANALVSVTISELSAFAGWVRSAKIRRGLWANGGWLCSAKMRWGSQLMAVGFVLPKCTTGKAARAAIVNNNRNTMAVARRIARVHPARTPNGVGRAQAKPNTARMLAAAGPRKSSARPAASLSRSMRADRFVCRPRPCK